MSAFYEDGWIRIPYSGPELGVIEIGIGEDDPTYRPAYLQTVNGQRFAQVRPTNVSFSAAPRVWLRTNGVPVLIGRLAEQGVDARTRRRR